MYTLGRPMLLIFLKATYDNCAVGNNLRIPDLHNALPALAAINEAGASIFANVNYLTVNVHWLHVAAGVQP